MRYNGQTPDDTPEPVRQLIAVLGIDHALRVAQRHEAAIVLTLLTTKEATK